MSQPPTTPPPTPRSALDPFNCACDAPHSNNSDAVDQSGHCYALSLLCPVAAGLPTDSSRAAVDSGQAAEEPTDSPVTVYRLPHELLLRVFLELEHGTVLAIVPLVCSWWRAVSRDIPAIVLDLTLLPRAAGFRRASNDQRAEMITGVVRRFPRAEIVLNASGYADLSDTFVAAVAAQCPRLSGVMLRECTALTVAAVDALATHCPRMTAVDLGYCVVTDAAIVALLTRLPRLKRLNAERVADITNPDIATAVEHRHTIRSPRINAGGAAGILRGVAEESDVPPLPPPPPPRGLPLTAINLSKCELLSNQFVLALAQHCTRLTSVTLDWCTTLLDASIITLTEQCSQLTEISLRGNQLLTDDCVEALARNCPNLAAVLIGWIWMLTDKSVLTLAAKCSRLTTVDLSGCASITDVGIVALAQTSPHLAIVSINWCGGVTDVGVVALAENCPLLQSLSLTNCHSLTDTSSTALAKHCPLLTAEKVAGLGFRGVSADTMRNPIRPLWV
eukprot:m.221706 g.221706  ORF g.221706 m.221706 type:complete len:505 (-) comp25807_c1_seq1:207-1721(-)